MPRASAYTAVGSRLAQLVAPARVDLHTHTTSSDGDYTPSQVVAMARAARLAAVAVTDHDTFAGIAEAQRTTAGAIEVVTGVEISTSFAGREFHLLGYFVRLDHPELNAALERVRDGRRERFRALVALLRDRGVQISDDRVELTERASDSLGRRHAADLVIASGAARTRHEALQRFVHPVLKNAPAKVLIPIEEAVTLVRAAGGAASLAHPPDDLTDDTVVALKGSGLAALEAVYPWSRRAPETRLRALAEAHGLVVTGGSDCHGPTPAHRRIGSCAVTASELEALRERAGCAAG